MQYLLEILVALFILCIAGMSMHDNDQIKVVRKNDQIIEECNAGEGTDRTVDLPKGKRLVSAQAGEERGDVWYLLEDMNANYEPKTYIFKESTERRESEITITFVEHK